ncbi:MAG: TlyA family RNA methyltransferase [Spirochaetota bacterium]|nr:TlyA family RNA methyltransferase [Spirochaetota bacterium]
MKKGVRLDAYLVENRISRSIESAKREIITGWIKVNGETVRRPSEIISGNETITSKRPGGIFVSRGGDKLQHAIEYFKITIKDKVVVDLGASTGGFTHCLLLNGVSKVYAVDVGYGLLDYSLRYQPRVVVKERTNVRNLTRKSFDECIDFITLDLSFLSLLRIFDKIREIFIPVEGIMLIKPQFEAMSYELYRGVVIREEDHKSILLRVINSLIDQMITFKGITYSPIKGPAGNIEYFLYFDIGYDNYNASRYEVESTIIDVVEESHFVLNKHNKGVT